MSRTSLERAVLSSILAAALVACSPPIRHPYQADDNTPANSTSESRLAGEDPNRPQAKPESVTSSADDPTAPQVNKVSDMPKAADDGSTKGADSSKKTASDAKGTKPGKGGPKVSQAECDQVLEKALELEIGSKPEFAGIDKKELIAQTKAMAKQQHGDAPCEATRPQYTCAMAATSTAQWKRCMQ